MSSSEFIIDYENSYNHEHVSGMSNNLDETNNKYFRGPARFTCKIDPLDEGDYTVKPPTVGS